MSNGPPFNSRRSRPTPGRSEMLTAEYTEALARSLPTHRRTEVDRCEMCGDVAVVRMMLADGAPMQMCRDCADLRYMEMFDDE